MVSKNPAPAISIAATGQDGNFETKLNAIENGIYNLVRPLEKFILTKHASGKSRGGNHRGYLTDVSVNASQSKIDQSSDNESNCGSSTLKRPNKNILNVDICGASKDVFDKGINLLVPDAQKQDQSGKESSAGNDLAILQEMYKGPTKSSKLAKVALKYWSEDSKNPVVVNKIMDGLKIHAYSSGIGVPI